MEKEDKKRDEILLRMLKTPPSPKKQAKTESSVTFRRGGPQSAPAKKTIGKVRVRVGKGKS